MHLQLYVRGLCPQVELWKSMMQNHFFKWRRTNIKTGKEEITLVQGGLRNSVLGTYEFTFPEESLPDVLSLIGSTSKEKIGIGVQNSFMNRTRLATLRKLCNVKKIPKSAFEKAKKLKSSVYFNDSERGFSDVIIPGTSVHPIGIKKDKQITMYDPQFKATFEQEAL